MERPNVVLALSKLKDFQTKTVDHAFKQLFLSPRGSGRFLVADEVGLGKTIVARGLIAKAVDHLWDKEERIDILYICSNADIARQNIRKLQLDGTGASKFSFATRSTLLPIEISELQKNKINYISITPGTSLEMKSNLGISKERVLLYWLLKEEWELHSTSAMNILQGEKGVDNFRYEIDNFRTDKINQSIKENFIMAIQSTNLRQRFEDLSSYFRKAKIRSNIPREIRKKQNQLIGEMRTLLAMTCLDSLQPNLIIMDEFQRFKNLFNEETEAGELASQLCKHTDRVEGSKMLLLSATPYKMYTIYDEQDGEDHYKDFLSTLDFLYKDTEKTQYVKRILKSFREEIYRIGESDDNKKRVRHIKYELETELREVMVRTERLGVSDDRNGMLMQYIPKTLPLAKGDVEDYVSMQLIAEEVEQYNVLEYWKSSPYLLNVMDHYQLKQVFTDAIDNTEREHALSSIIGKNMAMLLSKDDIQKYDQVDMRNMRLRHLVDSYLEDGLWKCLWLPPSAPYYQLNGCFKDKATATKRLVFSSWRIVPKVITALLSYEVERRIHDEFDKEMENTREAREQRTGLLQFSVSKGRLTGMPVFSLLYPSETLARQFDPLRFLQNNECEKENQSLRSAENIRYEVEKKIRELLPLIDRHSKESEDQAWYWAAPILLDTHFNPEETKLWFERKELSSIWQLEESSEEENTKWDDHVDEIRKLLDGQLELGAMPKDLASHLSYVALASPAVCAYRSLLRQNVNTIEKTLQVKDAAAQIGWSFRSLFNVFEFISLIRGMNKKVEPYWRKVLEYCYDGCLQAVIDEYIHLLEESSVSTNDKELEISSRIHEALTLKATSLSFDDINVNGNQIVFNDSPIRMRARFAQRFGDEKAEDGNKTRSGQLRDAFNSPFWPFVLTTTSVGQEGLDFHQYCHAIIHWDLPANPVDFEQREGRIHRYKGHAVRKNVAQNYMPDFAKLLVGDSEKANDEVIKENPWNMLFAKAESDREPSELDLIPYWIYPLTNGSFIERHVFAHELSKDFQKLQALRTSLAIYRMVFGQPRQEDLVQFLTERYSEEETKGFIKELQINLSPKEKTYIQRSSYRV